MTGGGDLDEIEDAVLDESDDVGDEEDDVDEIDELGGDAEDAGPSGVNPQITDADPDPTAGASDIGGLPGGIDEDDRRGDDQHEVGGGQTGMGKGPTGS